MSRPTARGSEVRTMSVSKPMYDPKYCDGEPCVGDCDLCSLWKRFGDEEDDEEDVPAPIVRKKRRE